MDDVGNRVGMGRGWFGDMEWQIWIVARVVDMGGLELGIWRNFWNKGYYILYQLCTMIFILVKPSQICQNFVKDYLLHWRFVEFPQSPTKNQSLTKSLYLRFNPFNFYRSTAEIILSFRSWLKLHNSEYRNNMFSKKVIWRTFKTTKVIFKWSSCSAEIFCWASPLCLQFSNLLKKCFEGPFELHFLVWERNFKWLEIAEHGLVVKLSHHWWNRLVVCRNQSFSGSQRLIINSDIKFTRYMILSYALSKSWQEIQLGISNINILLVNTYYHHILSSSCLHTVM